MRRIQLAVMGVVWFLGAPAHAELTAHFRAEAIDGGCVNGDSEPVGAGDPDRYFRMAIFDEYSLNQTCPSGCTDDGTDSTEDVRSLDYCTQSTGCGAWNFTNQTLSKVVPGGGGVYFYFGLWDADSDADDSLGNHWFFANARRTARTDSNNNSSPYDADTPILDTCGGRDVEGSGSSGNYQLTYSAWFTDTTPPDLSASTPVHTDDGLFDVADNDTRLDWAWADAEDPDTGIDGYDFSLFDETLGSTVFNTLTAPSDGEISFCPSGCDRAFTPVHGHTYRLRVRATNGDYPSIDNASSVWSAWSESITVDLVDPNAVIASPAAASWHNADFSVDFQDDDDGVGLDPTACNWRVRSSGSTTRDWGTRACNASRVVTVGAGLDCRHEGSNACTVDTEAVDLARNASSVVSRTFSVDWTADAVGPVTARESASGPILSGAAWTTDRDPYFSWSPAASVSPIAGYSWGLNSSPDCGSIEVDANDPLAVQLPNGFLSGGAYQFQVRAIDVAGNCGPVSTATVRVDGDAEPVVNLHAVDQSGAAIPSATWQRERQPTFRWDASVSASPIAGYSYGTGTLTDCVVETSSTDASVGALPEGATTFWVRAVDAAGNCGPPANFTIYVDSTPDPIFNLQALTQQGGAPIFANVPQPDRTPWMQWDVPTSSSPIAGYSYGIGAMTDCSPETQMPGAGLGMLPDGPTTFSVRAVDAAGNCGAAATFVIVVADCGDGMVGPGEACDDGNADDTDACIACVEATCGDGFVWAGQEECDEGDDNSDTTADACRADCTLAACGDGVLDAGESCDEGDANSDDPDATCRTNCALATCGDGVVDAGEHCDDGEANSDVGPDACRTTCVPARCGDGVLDGGEVCDDGDENSDTAPDACRSTCMPPACGDGVVDEGEECEPGPSTQDLVCFDDCQFGGSTMDDPAEADMGIAPDVGGGSAPDMGTSPVRPDMDSRLGADGGTPEDMVLGEATCCAQVGSRAYSAWQVVLALLCLVLAARRRQSRVDT